MEITSTTTTLETTQQTTKFKTTNTNIFEKHSSTTTTTVERVGNNQERGKIFKEEKIGMTDKELLAAANESGSE